MVSDAPLDDALEPDKGPAANEQDVGGVDWGELLMRMLASALWRNVGDRALQNLEQRLLDAFPGYVARDGRVLVLLGNLIDLVDVDDALLGAVNIEVRRLDQP